MNSPLRIAQLSLIALSLSGDLLAGCSLGEEVGAQPAERRSDPGVERSTSHARNDEWEEGEVIDRVVGTFIAGVYDAGPAPYEAAHWECAEVFDLLFQDTHVGATWEFPMPLCEGCDYYLPADAVWDDEGSEALGFDECNPIDEPLIWDLRAGFDEMFAVSLEPELFDYPVVYWYVGGQYSTEPYPANWLPVSYLREPLTEDEYHALEWEWFMFLRPDHEADLEYYMGSFYAEPYFLED